MGSEDIFLLGRSIGTGVATHFASHNKVGGLILVSPFTSINDIVEKKSGFFLAPVTSAVRNRFESVKAIPSVLCPTLFIHGEDDTFITPAHSVTLHANSGAASKRLLR